MYIVLLFRNMYSVHPTSYSSNLIIYIPICLVYTYDIYIYNMLYN